MATFKVTAKREINGQITKGLSVQIDKSLNKPNLKDVLNAYEMQFGIKMVCSMDITYFNIEEVK